MDILLYVIILAIGGFLGYRRLFKPAVMNRLDTLQNLSLLLLLFIMGVNIGLDQEVIYTFGTIGFQAIVLAAFSIVFSVIGVKLVSSRIIKQK
ncbi:MAG: DUF340 domain-containing protein [Tindallia sp. MSAO_Bac2]|nr:MAG: DUF340 domain-containing protein [Tindallia sp. MSAO_Bac2]